MTKQLSPPFSATSSPLRYDRLTLSSSTSNSNSSPSNSNNNQSHDALRSNPQTQTLPHSKPTLPSTYRDTNNNLIRLSSSSSSSVLEFITQDLSLTRLNAMHKHLWLAGRPTCARPLHRQRMIDRTIIITEQCDFHLVWHESRIFLKPLPDYLLSYEVWRDVICKDADNDMGKAGVGVYVDACGFLMSYVWLLCYPSDLEIAIQSGLISKDVTWEAWTGFVDEFLSKLSSFSSSSPSSTLSTSNEDEEASLPSPTSLEELTKQILNPRYHYGELRLNRLNAIYRLTQIKVFSTTNGQFNFLRGYMYGYNRYTIFFERNFGWLLLVFLYMTIILTAIQVGLGTEELVADRRFQRVAVGFAIFSIVLPVSVAGVGGVLFLWLVLSNLLATRVFCTRGGGEKRRGKRGGNREEW